MKSVLVVIIFSIQLALFAQNSPEVEVQVRNQKVPCSTNSNELCFHAKKVTDPTWTFTIQEIENFEFIEGTSYTLLLELGFKEENGTTKTTYKLVEVINEE